MGAGWINEVIFPKGRLFEKLVGDTVQTHNNDKIVKLLQLK